MSIDYDKLITVLVDSGLITPQQAKEVKQLVRRDSKSPEDVLLEGEYISDEYLGQLMADLYNVPFVELKKKNIDEAVLRIIPELVARRQQIVAFERDAQGVKLAMHRPDDEEMIQFIQKKTGNQVIPYFATKQDILEALTHYRKGLQEEFDSIIQKSIAETRQSSGEERELPVKRIVDTILAYAYNNKVSDIHIEPHDAGVVVRFRIDGILHDVVTMPKDVHAFVITRIKILAKLRTDEHRAAQDGRLEFRADDSQVDVRVSIIPVSDGEKVVMRVLSERSRQFNLSDLGIQRQDLKKLEQGIHKPYGMILATGPTGSGKTTTLYSILKILNKRTVNISTIEDPVEYDIEGVNQIQVNSKTNLTFAHGLRSILRQDPDIIMVGEIRDEETASIAINAAMTGHLVLSTLHTNDAPTTLPRLIDMKIEPFLIATTVNVALSQRLVRKIHRGCIESYVPTADELRHFEQTISSERLEQLGAKKKGFRLYRGRGCQLCNHTGYEGRIGIFEILLMTERIRQLIMQQANSDMIRQAAVAEGMTTMLDDGLEKAVQGLTTIDEVLRATRE